MKKLQRHSENAENGIKSNTGVSKIVTYKDFLQNPSLNVLSDLSKHTFHKMKSQFKIYFEGAKLLRIEAAQAAKIAQSKKFEDFTRKDFLLVQRSKDDVKKLIPFFFLLLLLPEAIPFVIIYNPGFIPSTCWSKEQILDRRANNDKRRLELGKLILESFEIGTVVKVANISPKQFLDSDFYQRLIISQRQYFDVNKFDTNQLAFFSKFMGLYHKGPRYFTKRRLNKILEFIRNDDKFILKEGGVEKLELCEIQDACEKRGIPITSRPAGHYTKDLKDWVTVSLLKQDSIEHHGTEDVYFVPSGFILMWNSIKVGLMK
ncbi:hypothetical protein HDU92_002341 [Lobulomyces angularis]|nr:hypothetical protein HDU92_002341 [Lobulomyces angularis]